VSSVSGRLVIVGTGIQLGRDLSSRTEQEIRSADLVFAATDEFALAWLKTVRPDLVDLTAFYGDGKDRRKTYAEMVERVLASLDKGARLCAAFYGHPGVFAQVSHELIQRARAMGHQALMLPGVSADACLYADLGLDPGDWGVQMFEATQFLVYQRQVDPTSLLILWQIGLCGDLTGRRFTTSPERLAMLTEKLQQWYLPTTPITLYEASWLGIAPHRADRLLLNELPGAALREYTTLVIPPPARPTPDHPMRQRLI